MHVDSVEIRDLIRDESFDKIDENKYGYDYGEELS